MIALTAYWCLFFTARYMKKAIENELAAWYLNCHATWRVQKRKQSRMSLQPGILSAVQPGGTCSGLVRSEVKRGEPCRSWVGEWELWCCTLVRVVDIIVDCAIIVELWMELWIMGQGRVLVD